MKVAVVGSREFTDYQLMRRILNKIATIIEIDAIVSGGARGADTLAEKYANEHHIKTIIFPAEWDKYGNRAGFLRDEKIVKSSDVVVAFWDGKSKGTQHTINLGHKHGKKVIVIKNGKIDG